ncbi:MAG TPA: hypothetical protein VN258_07480 [Mobilitalea sp.]|nr:hypothetical protein [Mobilitalea sp.]
MYHLIKYEVRKQILTKIIIVLFLCAFEIMLIISVLSGNKDSITIVNGILKVAAVIGLFYIAFDPIAAFDNDLGKKQGYLLFMTPNSTQRIITAKLLAGAIQFMLYYSLFVGLFTMNNGLLSWSYGTTVNQLDDIFNAFGDVGFSFTEFIVTGIFLLCLWFDVISLTFLSISISYAYISKGKLNTFISILLFIILFIAETLLISGPIMITFDASGSLEASFILLSNLLFVIPAIFNYCSTILTLDKKVSI